MHQSSLGKMRVSLEITSDREKEKNRLNRHKKNHETHITCYGYGKVGHREQHSMAFRKLGQEAVVADVVGDIVANVALMASCEDSASAVPPVAGPKSR